MLQDVHQHVTDSFEDDRQGADHPIPPNRQEGRSLPLRPFIPYRRFPRLGKTEGLTGRETPTAGPHAASPVKSRGTAALLSFEQLGQQRIGATRGMYNAASTWIAVPRDVHDLGGRRAGHVCGGHEPRRRLWSRRCRRSFLMSRRLGRVPSRLEPRPAHRCARSRNSPRGENERNSGHVSKGRGAQLNGWKKCCREKRHGC